MLSEMSKRERLLAALNSRETDRLPWAPLIDGYFISSLFEQGLDMDILAAMRFIGNDIMERHVAGPTERMEHVTLREEQRGGLNRTYYETPVGSLYVERKPSGRTSYICKHMIESLEDIKVFTYIAEHTVYQPNISAFISREKEIGDDGIATLSGNTSPIQEVLQILGGVENTVYLMMDYPDEMDTLFAAMHERNLRQYKVLAQYPCGVVFDYEDTSTTVMNRSMFTDYSMPAFNDYADLLHGAGKLFITHMCGKLTGFAHEIGQGRQDGIDSVCPPNTGDLCPWDARRIWGSRKVVVGGIDPPALSRMTTEESVDTAIEICKKVENKNGYILSTGDAVPYGTPVQNLIAVTKLIEQLGRGSLTGDFDPEQAKVRVLHAL